MPDSPPTLESGEDKRLVDALIEIYSLAGADDGARDRLEAIEVIVREALREQTHA